MTEPEPGPEPGRPEPGAEQEPEEEHQPDGLDLARAITRSTAGAGTTPRKRRRPRRSDPDRSRSRTSGAHPDDRDPQPLEATVSRLVDDQGWELSLRMRGVFARWAEIVGSEVADHSAPESFAEGRLVVRTDSTAWATQLRMLAPDLVRRLNDDLGQGTVTVIEVEGPHRPSWKKGRLSARDGRGPRDTYG